jgi:hypothetical protein
VAASNRISLVSFPWLLQRAAGRQLLPSPAATEDVSRVGAPLQGSCRGGSTGSRGGGVSRGRGRGRKASAAVNAAITPAVVTAAVSAMVAARTHHGRCKHSLKAMSAGLSLLHCHLLVCMPAPSVLHDAMCACATIAQYRCIGIQTLRGGRGVSLEREPVCLCM